MIDFFDRAHNPQPFTHKSVWCADKQTNTAAYLTLDGNDRAAVAEIGNEKEKEVTFVAVDNNIDLGGEKRCDVMLHFENSLYFVELKDKRSGGWISEAAEQLISTINIFRQNHNEANFKKKRAYACNKVHPYFHSLETEVGNKFRQNTGGFKLLVEGKITI